MVAKLTIKPIEPHAPPKKTKASQPATKAEQVLYRRHLEDQKSGKRRVVLSRTVGLRLLDALDEAYAHTANAEHARDAILGTLFRRGVCFKSLCDKELLACPEGTWLYPEATMPTIEAGMRQEFCSDCAQQKVYSLHGADADLRWRQGFKEFLHDKANIFANKAIMLAVRDTSRDRRFSGGKTDRRCLDRRQQVIAMNPAEDKRVGERRSSDRRQGDRRRDLE